MISINDQECKDTMKKAITNYSSEFDHDWHHLTSNDENLLINYATMFDTFHYCDYDYAEIPKPDNDNLHNIILELDPNYLYNAMLGLVKVVAEFRYDKLWQTKEKELHLQKRSGRDNSSKQNQKQSALNDINKILDYMGYTYIPLHSSSKRGTPRSLGYELTKAKENIGEYSREKDRTIIDTSKDPIATYLAGLFLKGKSTIIKKFIGKID